MPTRPDLGQDVFGELETNGDTVVTVKQESMREIHVYIKKLENSFKRCGGVR